MNVRRLRHFQIDKQAWDNCINHSPNGLVYALSWYLDVVAPGWEAIVIAQGSEYQVCFPLPVRKRWGITYIAHPYFCQQLGIYYRDLLDNKVVERLIQTLFSHYSYIPRLFLNVDNQWDFPPHSNLQQRCHYTHLLKLDQPYTTIHQNYRRDRKYRLKQAQRRNISLVSSQDIEPLIDIFLQDTVQKVPGAEADPTYALLRQLFATVKQHGRYELYYIKDERGKYTSGCWFVIYNHRIIYLFNAALDSARRENGRTLIIDHVIRKYQNSPYVVDFESPEKETIYDFYASFGSQPTPFPFFYFNNLPLLVRKLHRAKIRWHRRLLRYVYPCRQLPTIILPR